MEQQRVISECCLRCEQHCKQGLIFISTHCPKMQTRRLSRLAEQRIKINFNQSIEKN
jgi:hypothetical protein